VTLSLSQHAAEAKTTESLHKHRIFNESSVLQMLRLACGGAQGAIATAALFHSNPQSLGSLSICDVAEYLRCERGFKEATIYTYRRHVSEFAEYLRRAGVASFRGSATVARRR
jgi:hypothetical protein